MRCKVGVHVLTALLLYSHFLLTSRLNMTNDPIPTIFEIDANNLTPTSTIAFIELNSTSEDLKSFVNNSQLYAQQEYIFDQFYIRAIFIALYTVVFAFCFFGKYDNQIN